MRRLRGICMSRSFVSVGRQRGGGIVCLFSISIYFLFLVEEGKNEGRENERIEFANVSTFLLSQCWVKQTCMRICTRPDLNPRSKTAPARSGMW